MLLVDLSYDSTSTHMLSGFPVSDTASSMGGDEGEAIFSVRSTRGAASLKSGVVRGWEERESEL